MSTNQQPSAVLDDEDDIAFHQIADIMEGIGATEDHEALTKWFKDAGMPEKLIPFVHEALASYYSTK